MKDAKDPDRNRVTETLHENGVLELVIRHPPVNAFSIGLLNDLSSRLEAVSTRPEVRVVILRSEGRGFCGGGDVKEVTQLPGFEGILGQAAGSLRSSLAVLQCAVPVVCAVHTFCVGVGVLIAASADILIAAAGTRFVLAEVDNGATAGGVQALRILPEKRVRAAMMTAEPVLAEELLALGTLYRVVASDSELSSAAHTVAATVAAKNPETIRRLKRSLNHSAKVYELEAQYRAELSYTFELNIRGDATDGRKAFFSGERPGYMAD